VLVSNRPAIIWGTLAGFVAGTLAGAIMGSNIHPGVPGLVAIGVGLWVGRRIYKAQYHAAKEHNDRDYRPKKASWDRSVMCMRCGAITELVTVLT